MNRCQKTTAVLFVALLVALGACSTTPDAEDAMEDTQQPTEQPRQAESDTPNQPDQPTAALDPDGLQIGDSYTRGDDDPTVRIYKFSSFQCPYCAQAAVTVRQLFEEYEGDLQLVHKNFPLPGQDASEPAARAALAAGEQGKFWQMHDRLYDNINRVGEEGLFVELAEDLELDIDQFEDDLESDELAERVAAEHQQGIDIGVQGTPAIFVNGERVDGAQPITEYRRIIDQFVD